jgi:hypothetical protein
MLRQYRVSRREAPALEPEFAGLETFCLFIGYPRSGHSLVGSLIDAHPEAIIAHEANALRYIKYGFGRSQLFYQLIENSKEFAEKGRLITGYSYEVPNQWQGRYSRLRVIGDKRGGSSVRRLMARPGLIDQLQSTVALPVKWIHVIRNPYDNVATIFRRSKRDLEGSLDFYFRHVNGVAGIRDRIPEADLLEIRHEGIIADPTQHLKQLCAFLGLEPDEKYLCDCASILFESPKRTREGVEWTPDQRARIEAEIARLPFLNGYRFDS